MAKKGAQGRSVLTPTVFEVPLLFVVETFTADILRTTFVRKTTCNDTRNGQITDHGHPPPQNYVIHSFDSIYELHV